MDGEFKTTCFGHWHNFFQKQKEMLFQLLRPDACILAQGFENFGFREMLLTAGQSHEGVLEQDCFFAFSHLTEAGGGLLYFCSEEGDCFVVKAADSFEVVSKNHLAEGMRASPSAADGTLFLRTFTHLYAIRQ